MKQFNQLPETTSANNSDLLAIQTSEGTTKRITKENFLEGLSTGGSSMQFEFKLNGDKQGLIYYLGTNAYTQNFTNPANNGTVTTSESTLLGAGIGFNQVFDRGGNIFHTNIGSDQWGKIDLGSTRSFLLKYYSIRARSDDNNHHPRNWLMQGSNDNSTWTTLDTQTSRSDFTLGSWLTFDLRENSTAYRYFRFFQNGLNSNSSTYLTLGEMELYGSLV